MDVCLFYASLRNSNKYDKYFAMRYEVITTFYDVRFLFYNQKNLNYRITQSCMQIK